MRLVVDTSVLVGELLRRRGRERLADDRLELFLSEQAHGEVHHELPRRITAFAEHRGLAARQRASLIRRTLEAVDATTVVVPEAVYGQVEREARWRSWRDPDDWHVIGTALVLECGVWTNDNDFLGTGVPTWSTQTLDRWLVGVEGPKR